MNHLFSKALLHDLHLSDNVVLFSQNSTKIQNSMMYFCVHPFSKNLYLTGVLGCCVCTEVGCCMWLGGSVWGCRGVSGREDSGGVLMAEGGPGRLLGMWVGVEEGPPAEAGVGVLGGTWACADAWCCCGCRLAEVLGGGVARRVVWAAGPQGSWEPRDPNAFRGRLEFCGYGTKTDAQLAD